MYFDEADLAQAQEHIKRDIARIMRKRSMAGVMATFMENIKLTQTKLVPEVMKPFSDKVRESCLRLEESNMRSVTLKEEAEADNDQTVAALKRRTESLRQLRDALP